VAPIGNTVELARPPEEAFAYITDPSHFSEWQDAVESAEVEGGGPVGQGTRVKMRRRMGGRMQDVTTEITEFSPPHSYAFRGVDGPVRAIGKGRIEPAGEGRSLFTFEIDFEGRGLGKVLLPLVRRQAKQELIATHRDLESRMESGGGGAY
jgi:uncharacterized protein YndB with AHSA1/START domain